MEFEYPLVFLLIIFFIIGEKYFKLKLDALIFPHLFSEYKLKNSKILLLKWIGILLCITSLSSPVLQKNLKQKQMPAYAISILLDASGSMNHSYFVSSDKRYTKFDIAKKVASKFVSKRKNDHVGVVLFADYAYVISPLSYDIKSASIILKNISKGIAGDKTALFDAIFISSQMLKKSKAKEKIAIILSDGEDTASFISSEDSIRFAKKENLRIYCIYVGVKNIPHELKNIAKQTGGLAYSAKNIKALEEIYDNINQLEKTNLKSKAFFYKQYLYQWFLFFGLLSLIFYVYFRHKRVSL